jgi:signal peptidase I
MPEVAETTAAPANKKPPAKKPAPQPDRTREVIETIVFVVVLVLLLKLFVTEAFVIPTGSMAETLYGIHKMLTCPKCGIEFPVNSHDEVEGNPAGRRTPLYGYCCPNCRYQGLVNEFPPPGPENSTGDRVLVLKPVYHLKDPQRGDVVVFKYPKLPQERQTASNYIKRAEGFGGETIAIYKGDLYVTRALSYPADDPLFPRPENRLNLWQPQYMYSTNNGPNPQAVKLFDSSRDAGFPATANGLGTGGFEIVRKGEEQLLADRRIVWDNDKQPKELGGFNVPSRWYALKEGEAFWKADTREQPTVFEHTGDGTDLHWIRYRHLPMPWKSTPAADEGNPDRLQLVRQEPKPIDNFLGYNEGTEMDPVTGQLMSSRGNSPVERLWVGDLILECEVIVENGAEAVLELSKGVNRFRATFGNGRVALRQFGRGGDAFKEPTRPCKVTAGTYRLRFANVDSRLWVWVNGKNIDFGPDGDYSPVEPLPGDKANPEGWTQENDVDAPASIGAKGKVTIRHITLHRDIYYTRTGYSWYKIDKPVLDRLKAQNAPQAVLEKLGALTDKPFSSREGLHAEVASVLGAAGIDGWTDTIVKEAELPGADIFYVQPGHYLCLGDNSAQSSDSRSWGTVPERLLLGKAVFVFWPGWPKSRVGFIK